jgi:ubiquinone/menaquinone biosynthesis C-methylase UbiE
LAPLLIEFAEIQNGDRVLDVGCGTGSLTRALLEHMPRSEMVGVDPASPYIEYGRQQLTNRQARLEVGDAQNLQYPIAIFDKCLSLAERWSSIGSSHCSAGSSLSYNCS